MRPRHPTSVTRPSSTSTGTAARPPVRARRSAGSRIPEPLPFAARHWLGAALLEARRYADAERVYREELLDHPRNGWSLFGLRQALAGLGSPSTEVDDAFAASWSRSDTWIRASRF